MDINGMNYRVQKAESKEENIQTELLLIFVLEGEMSLRYQDEKYLMEVKGCTLEIDGIGYFPDAPSERAVRHLHELMHAVKQGYHCILAFVIAMPGVMVVRPNMTTHPAFGQALSEAMAAGVEVWYLPCEITADSIQIKGRKRKYYTVQDGLYPHMVIQ